MKAVTNQINQITSDLKSKGFQEYGDFSHPDRIEYKDINQFYMTCLKGKYEGDVAEIWYNFKTGEVVKKITYSQFHRCEPKLKF